MLLIVSYQSPRAPPSQTMSTTHRLYRNEVKERASNTLQIAGFQIDSFNTSDFLAPTQEENWSISSSLAGACFRLYCRGMRRQHG